MGRSGLALAAAAAVLAGCAGGVVQHYAYHPAYTGATATYAASDRDLAVIVIGNPTGLPKDRFDRAVTAAMQGKNGQNGTRFTTSPGPSWRRDYRVVLAFGAPGAATGATYCRYGEPPAPAARARPVRVVAAFCDAERLLSEVVATAAGVGGPDDPGLDVLMDGIMLALMPAEAPHERQGPGSDDFDSSQRDDVSGRSLAARIR